MRRAHRFEDAADAYARAPSVVDSLSYADVDITRTPLRDVSLAALLLTRPLQYVAPPAGGWCSFLASKALNCSNGVDLSKT
ncbi:MAG: hypothetical protein ABR562_10195, partial [Thermoplasmatota archaeon]